MKSPKRKSDPAPKSSPSASAKAVTLPDDTKLKSSSFDGYIVAIGASAGGLEALERFFRSCSSSTGASFVVIQHLSPDHKSMMHDLLGRYTEMTVTVVADGMVIEPNNVYLIPPGTLMRVEKGCFQLSPKNPHLLTLPIDIFLNSLADEQGTRSIAVILSGTGSDGSRGAVSVNAAGGLLLAQDPSDARFDGMPASVINTGLVDAVLPADKLASRVESYIKNEPLEPQVFIEPVVRIPLTDEEAQESILQILLQAGGIDFHDYKQATLIRRIQRRMQVKHIKKLEHYLALLESEREELATLRRELLIPVTSFFRDEEAFDTLKTEVIQPLVNETAVGDVIRVWVAGCSTGEEAYSIAMLFMEEFDVQKRWPSLKIFATDVNQINVDFAAAGQYPESAAAELTPERLERFFHASTGSYSVKPELRQTIVFARHNLLADPPFTRMSLVSCRNTLIYFNTDAQRRALNRLQYAIGPDGFLFLGSSEALGNNAAGFAVQHAKHKLFKRSGPSSSPAFSPDEAMRSYVPTLKGKSSVASLKSLSDSMYVDQALQMIVDDFAPPSMLVNERHEVIHMFGNVAPFFQGRSGSASLELNRILPEGVLPVASALLYKANKDGARMVSDLLRMSSDEQGERAVQLIVKPMVLPSQEKLMLLSFLVRRNPDLPNPAEVTVNVNEETVERVDILERELLATRESLQATIEELETSNEELQATNEELQASNEEMQSSNEELQSVNEELNTVNAEFQEKMSILNRVNADLDSMSKAAGVATVFLDDDLQLTRFSPDAAMIFKLRASDIGRPIDEITHVLSYPALIDDFRMTLSSSRMLEKEARSHDGKVYLIRILPYAIPSSLAKGVVASFVDITAFQDRQRLQDILDALPEHVAVLDADGTIVMVNRAWVRFAKANGDPELKHTGIGCNYLEACSMDDKSEEDQQASQARKGIKAVLEGSSPSFSLQYPCHSPNEQRWFVMNVSPISGHQLGAVVSHFNVSSWHLDSRVRQ